MAGNRKLTSIYRKLIKELSLFRRLNLADGWLMPISAGEHRKSSRPSPAATPKPPAAPCSTMSWKARSEPLPTTCGVRVWVWRAFRTPV
jgi:hypothetical protein